ncbi:MAG: DNA repair protein RecO [Lachnospiraceae bacterium]|nr:DNA repair protein RecO [Lachnospiraceae bacterium]
MREFVLVNGMILETGPVSDYDRRLVVLTKERGKITVFARGCRRPGNKYMAATNPFCFGTFKLYEGKTAYNLADVEITHYFEELRTDYEGAYLGMYFLELASYYARENNDEVELLKLLFQSVRAIIKPNLDNALVRAIYEIKALVVNGLFPGLPADKQYLNATQYAVDFIVRTGVEHLYTFAVTEEVQKELTQLCDIYRKRFYDREFKSLKLFDELKALGYN